MQLFSYIPAKQRLHEWSQKQYREVPQYKLMGEYRESHQKIYFKWSSLERQINKNRASKLTSKNTRNGKYE